MDQLHSLRTALVAAVLAMSGGCAGGDPAPSGGDTDFVTAGTTSTTSTSDDSDSSDSRTTSTSQDSADATSSTGDGESSSSTGCMDGEAGCACRAEEPVCDADLECVLDVCAGDFCEGGEDDEPNDDAPDESVDLGSHSDSDPSMNVASQLGGPLDVDWFSYSCTDTLGPDLDPQLVIDQTTTMRVCFFLDCAMGGNPLFECSAGSTEAMAPFGFLPGCCVTDATTIDLSGYNCPDASNDSVTAWIRVDMGDTIECEPYSLTYNC